MLDSFENRKGYVLAFGLVTNSIISVVLGEEKELLGADTAADIQSGLSEYPFFKGKPSYRCF